MALIAHKDVPALHADTAERTIWVAMDNRAALSWSDKESSISTAAQAYLLRLNALHQQTHCYVSIHDHIAGKANGMVNDASQLWHLSDHALLTHFNTHYLQASPWEILTPSLSTILALTGLLFKQQPKIASQLT
jgi:hypothetical protein